MTVLVLSKSTIMSCFLSKARASADSPCIGCFPKCRDWKTRGSEWCLLWVLQKTIRHGKDWSRLPAPVPGHRMGCQGHWAQLRSPSGRNTCSAWWCKKLSNVLSFPHPGYLISNLFSNWGFGNSNRLLSLKKNEIFVGDRCGFSKFNLCVEHPCVLQYRVPLLALITPSPLGHLKLIRAAVSCRSNQ